MKKLTAEQQLHVRKFLASQGLTFSPLVEEMFDHLSSDIEERMQDGLSFEDAWHQMKNDIPENHLQHIQNETMETITKRFSLSRLLSILALALMFGGIAFKILHLAGASQLLLLSFAAMAGSFISGTVSGIYFHKEKKGAARVLSIVAGTLVLLMAYTFRIMRWPGADQLVLLGVCVSLLSFLFNTIYIFRSSSPNANLLSYLHEKHSPGIERFFLILLLPTAILRIIMLPLPGHAFLGTIIFVTIIYGTGVQFYTLTWRLLETGTDKRNALIFSVLVISFTCFILVFLGELLAFEIRLVLIALFSILAAWLTYRIDPPKNSFVKAVLILVPLLFTANVLLRLNLLPPSATNLFFNVVILVILAAGVFVSPKHEATRTFLILSLAGYLTEYSGNLI
jgi:hypothetical protein